MQAWPSELFCWTAGSRAELGENLKALEQALDGAGAAPELRELARAVWAPDGGARVRLAIVATSIGDLRAKLVKVRDVIAAGTAGIWDRSGVYLTTEPLVGEGTVAFLYPGQGSQHPDMLRDLAICFPEVRETFERADAVLAGRTDRPLSATVFAPPGFGSDDVAARARELTRTDRAQPALGAAGMGLSRLLAAVGVAPSMTAGHSYGEYVALCRAGVLDEDVLYQLSEARGRSIIDAAQGDLGTMAAVSAGPVRVREVLGCTLDMGASDVWIANVNAPQQTVVSGTREGIDRALKQLTGAGIGTQLLTVGCGFHSPLVAPARDRFAVALAGVEFAAPLLPVYANTSATLYPAEPDEIGGLLADHLVQPVRFAEQIEQMYAAGARLFVETGPRAVLTGLVGQVLGARPHLAVPTQGLGHGLTAFQHALAQLHAHGVGLDLERLYRGRVTRLLRLDTLADELAPAPLPATTWLVDGGSARPLGEQSTTLEHPGNGHVEIPLPRAPEPSTLLPEDGADGMVLQFQQLMSKFLDTQQEVMTAYLRGTDPAGQSAPIVPQPTRSMPPQPVPAPARPAVEAGPTAVDTTAVDTTANGSTPAAPTAAPDADQVARELVRLAADRTGYPPEMLDLDADLDADLGIDSIKRVEILGAAQQALPASGDVLSGGMETLAKAKTLRALAETIIAMAGHDSRTDPATAGSPPPTAESAAATNGTAPAASDTALAAVADLPRFTATVLDAPLGETTLPLSGVVAITDDEQGIATELAASLP